MSELTQEPLLDMFIFETNQLLEQFEILIIDGEKSSVREKETIDEIFRIMHTIKGSSAMMNFNNISSLAHSIEDLFHILREKADITVDLSGISDLLLESSDYIKTEVLNIGNREIPGSDAMPLIERIRGIIESAEKCNGRDENEMPGGTLTEPADEFESSGKEVVISPKHESGESYKATIIFESDCQMEGMHAFTLVHSLGKIAADISHVPEMFSGQESDEIIRRQGLKISFKSLHTYEEIYNFFSQAIFLKRFDLVSENIEKIRDNPENTEAASRQKELENCSHLVSTHHSIISVNVSKLDRLMDLMGELVISEAMVTQNPDLAGLALDRFQKAARQHRKIIDELQDIVMSVRMVPLSGTFQKMNRIVRDMCRKLEKDVRLEIIGEETEVDKNIIEHISDPLMHLIRNAIDHGIEAAAERISKGKPEIGKVTLEAMSAGGDVLIIIRDDGRGLNREKILARAIKNGLINRSENELCDKEIYSYIFLPGFSTKDEATEFSGRGVGMDVVTKNIGAVGGSVSVDSDPGKGTTVTLKIPLTLAILDGMTISVGNSRYTIPMTSIRESFKPKEGDVFTDSDGNEMIMIRGECYPVLRLHEFYRVRSAVTQIHDGILVMVENDSKGLCILADQLIGEQQVVVKPLPEYIRSFKGARGLAGCTLLGDGSISLIIDAAALFG